MNSLLISTANSETATADADSILITTTINYQAGVIPPRCRNPRRQALTWQANAFLAEASPEAAPLVAEVVTQEDGWDHHRRIETTVIREFRGWAGRLWTRDPEVEGIAGVAEALRKKAEEALRWDMRQETAIQAMTEAIDRWTSAHVLIGDDVWITSKEPLLHILGESRYSDTYDLVLAYDEDRSARSGDEYWYRLDEVALAVATMDKLADERNQRRILRGREDKVEGRNRNRIRVDRPDLLLFQGQAAHAAHYTWNRVSLALEEARSHLITPLHRIPELQDALRRAAPPAGCNAADVQEMAELLTQVGKLAARMLGVEGEAHV